MNTSLRLTVAAATAMTAAFSASPIAAQCRSQQPQYGGGDTTLPYNSTPEAYQPDPIFARRGHDLEKCTTTSGALSSWLPPSVSPAAYQDPVNQATETYAADSRNRAPATSAATLPDADLPVLTAGNQLPLRGVAEARGLAQLKIGGLALNLSVLDWKDGTATIELPNLNIDGPVRGELRVLTAAGDLQRAVDVMLEPAKRPPVQSAPQLPTIVAGEELNLNFDGIGNESGQVKLKVAGIAVNVVVLEWKAGTIVIAVPKLSFTDSVQAELQVLRADGSEIALQAVEFAPATQS